MFRKFGKHERFFMIDIDSLGRIDKKFKNYTSRSGKYDEREGIKTDSTDKTIEHIGTI